MVGTSLHEIKVLILKEKIIINCCIFDIYYYLFSMYCNTVPSAKHIWLDCPAFNVCWKLLYEIKRRFWVAACCSVGLLQLIECVRFTHLCLQAVRLLKRGGVLVYSTCTVTLAENEEQVAWALKTFPCLTLEPQVRIKTLPKQQTFYIPERSKLTE